MSFDLDILFFDPFYPFIFFYCDESYAKTAWNDPKGVGFTSTFISQLNLLFRFTFLDRYTPTA
jgi:hypothetical protein